MSITPGIGINIIYVLYMIMEELGYSIDNGSYIFVLIIMKNVCN